MSTVTFIIVATEKFQLDPATVIKHESGYGYHEVERVTVDAENEKEFTTRLDNDSSVLRYSVQSRTE